MNSNKIKIILFGGTGLVGTSFKNFINESNFEIFSPIRKEVDLFDINQVSSYIKTISPEFVINCAGKVGGIAVNKENHFDFYVDNLRIGKNIIDGCLSANVKNLLNLGSSCMYPTNILDRKLVEEDILRGPLEQTNEGYALAKISVMKLCIFSNEKYKTNFKTLIPCNLYGPNDKFDLYNSHLIPAIINKVHHAIKNNINEIEIWGTGEVKREFMYSDDLANSILFTLNSWEKLPNIINVGVGYDLSVNEYYAQVAKTLGWKGRFFHNKDKSEGMKNKLMDSSIIRGIGWEPIVDLEEGITKTYNFYINNLI